MRGARPALRSLCISPATVSGSLTKASAGCLNAPPRPFRLVYREFDRISYDPRKSDEVLAERGFYLAFIAHIFAGFVLEREDTGDYNETCYQVIGELLASIYFLVYKRRGRVCRLITVREAEPEDRAIWYEHR